MEVKDLIIGHDRNSDTFRLLHNNLRPPLARMIDRKFKFPQDERDDLLTDTFLAVWKTKVEFVSFLHFKRYLYNAILNRSRSLVKQRQQQVQKDKDLSHAIEHQQVTTEEQLNKEHTINLLTSLIMELPALYRDVLTLTYVEGLSVKEIAEKLEITHDNVYQIRSRGLKMLKELVGKRIPDDPNAYTFLITLLLQIIQNQSFPNT